MVRRVSGIPLPAATVLALATFAGVLAPLAGAMTPSLHVVRNTLWGVEVSVPGYEPSDHPLRAQSNFVLAATSTSRACRLGLSMFVAETHPGATPEDCRGSDIGDPDALSGRSDVQLIDQKEGPVAWSLFDRTLESRGGSQATYHQLYGYWTRDDLCFTLRVVSGEECDSFPKKAMSILRSVRVLRDAGATLETAELAKRRGGDPRDWRLHLQAAEAYMRDEAHRNPERARRFYASALRLAGARITPADRLAIEEGIGFSWLAEDNGEEAIPHLDRALEAARRGGRVVPPERLQDALYGLASAHALEGDVDAACGYARRWLEGKSGSDLKPAAKRIRKDPQMEALSGSDCYQAVLADLGLR